MKKYREKSLDKFLPYKYSGKVNNIINKYLGKENEMHVVETNP